MLTSRLFASKVKELSLYFVLLIACQAYAQTGDSVNALPNDNILSRSILVQLEELVEKEPKQVIFQLQQHQNDLIEYPLVFRMSYYKVLSDAYRYQGQYELSIKAANQGVALAAELTSPNILITELLNIQGYAYESLGNYQQASNSYNQALTVAQSLNNKEMVATSLVNLGSIFYLRENYQESLTFLNEALQISKHLDNNMKGAVNNALGNLFNMLEQPTKAQQFFESAYVSFEQTDSRLNALSSLYNVGMALLSQKRFVKAIETFQQVVEQSLTKDYYELIFASYSAIAVCYELMDIPKLKLAYQYLLKAEPYLQYIEQPQDWVSFTLDKGFILYKLEHYQDALSIVHQLKTQLSSTQVYFSNSYIVSYLDLAAKTYAALGLYKEAYLANQEYSRLYIKYQAKTDSSYISELLLKYESKQADLAQQVLQKKQELQASKVVETEKQTTTYRFYFFMIALATLVLSWFLIKFNRQQKHLKKLTQLDALTQINRRCYAMATGHELFLKAMQCQLEFSCLRLCINDFKSINTNLGNAEGDKALKLVTHKIERCLRESDILGRYSSEEFIIFSSNTSLIQGREIADRITASIAELKMYDVSISVISTSQIKNATRTSFEELIRAADNQLYQAVYGQNSRVSNDA